MKKCIQYIIAMMMALVTTQSFAYNPNDSYEVAKEKLSKTDCSISSTDCRYYAAIEYVAFAKACPIAFAYKTKGTNEEIKEFDIMVNELINNWKAIQDPTMNQAVLSNHNPFKEKTTKDLISYLKGSPIDDVGIECSRIGLIKDNKMPEETSDLIATTVNFKQWHAQIKLKQQKDFEESQERLTKEMKEKYQK